MSKGSLRSVANIRGAPETSLATCVLWGVLGCLGKVSGDPLTQVLANVLGLLP